MFYLPSRTFACRKVEKMFVLLCELKLCLSRFGDDKNYCRRNIHPPSFQALIRKLVPLSFQFRCNFAVIVYGFYLVQLWNTIRRLLNRILLSNFLQTSIISKNILRISIRVFFGFVYSRTARNYDIICDSVLCHSKRVLK